MTKDGAVQSIISIFHVRTYIATTPIITKARVNHIHRFIPVAARYLVPTNSDAITNISDEITAAVNPITNLDKANCQYAVEKELIKAMTMVAIVNGTIIRTRPYLNI